MRRSVLAAIVIVVVVVPSTVVFLGLNLVSMTFSQSPALFSEHDSCNPYLTANLTYISKGPGLLIGKINLLNYNGLKVNSTTGYLLSGGQGDYVPQGGSFRLGWPGVRCISGSYFSAEVQMTYAFVNANFTPAPGNYTWNSYVGGKG